MSNADDLTVPGYLKVRDRVAYTLSATGSGVLTPSMTKVIAEGLLDTGYIDVEAVRKDLGL